VAYSESKSYLIKGSFMWFYVMFCQRVLLNWQSCWSQRSKDIFLSPCLAFCADMVAYGYFVWGLDAAFVDVFLPVHIATDMN